MGTGSESGLQVGHLVKVQKQAAFNSQNKAVPARSQDGGRLERNFRTARARALTHNLTEAVGVVERGGCAARERKGAGLFESRIARIARRQKAAIRAESRGAQ